MEQELLLDTNAFYNLIKALNPDGSEHDLFGSEVAEFKKSKMIVSTITEVEIISVLGKYARGRQGGFSKCGCKISQDGHICQNNRYIIPRKKWNKKRIKAWQQFISDILCGKSQYLTVGIEPFDNDTVVEAKKIIVHALLHNFGSMDAIIAATAKLAQNSGRDIVVVTSDKGLKACLQKVEVSYSDIFAVAQN